jgi:hypothetical protein
MFIRVVSGIHKHFDERVVEWSMAATGMFWGWTLAQPGTAWTNLAAWQGLLRIASEDTWGVISMIAGACWLVALAVNGTFADTNYSRYSPLVRGLVALGASVVWWQVVMSVSAVQTSGSGIYPLPLALSVWCVRNAWKDIGEERRSRRAHDRRT